MIRPSSAASWVYCHASAGLRLLYPDLDTEAAAEGTAAHFVAQCMLKNFPHPAVGQIAPNGVVITDEIIKGAKQYVDYVCGLGLPVYVEHELQMPRIHPLLKGTCDVWGIDTVNRVIHIIDFKFGLQPVDVFENWQLICYLEGVFNFLNFDGSHDQIYDVQFTIVQPRAYHRDGVVRTWRLSVAALRGHFNQLIAAASAAMGENPMATVGPQCTHCSARHSCNVLQKSGFIAVHISETPNPIELTTFQASNELQRLEAAQNILKSRITGLAAQVEHGLRRGEIAPHHSIEHSRTNWRWRDEGAEQAIIAMGKLLGKDLQEPTKAISPAQVRLLGVNESLVTQYAIKPTGTPKLVPVSLTTTKKLFQGN